MLGARLPGRGGLPAALAVPRRAGAGQPVGRRHPRVGDHRRRRRRTTSTASCVAGDPYDLDALRYDPADQAATCAQGPELGDRAPGGGRTDGEPRPPATTTRTWPTTSRARPSSSSRRKLGMWLFLATEILFFGGLFCAYAVYRANHPEIFIFAHHFLDKNLGAHQHGGADLLSSSPWPGRCARRSSGSVGLLKLMLVLTVAVRLRLPRHQVRRVPPQVARTACCGRAATAPHLRPRRGTACGAEEEHRADGASRRRPQRRRWPRPRPTPVAAADPNRSAIAPAAEGPAGLADRRTSRRPSTRSWPSRENAQIFFRIYFLMTGLHGIHVLGGIGAMFWLLVVRPPRRLRRRPLHPGRHGRPLLAPGGPDLDLPVPAALPDPLGATR